MSHELLEHLDRGAGVHVPLGVGVAQRVWEDPGRVEGHRVAAGAPEEVQASLGIEPTLEQL